MGSRPVALAIVLALLLAGTPTLAEPGPNAKPPRTTAGTVLDLAMADDGTVLATTDDPGTKLPTPGNAGPNASTWYLWSPSGTLLLQGSADLPTCSTRVDDLCQSPAPAAALARTGARFAVGSNVASSVTDAVKGLLSVGTPTGIVARQPLSPCAQGTNCPNAVVAVAVNHDGSSIAVLERVSHVNAPDTARVEWFDLSATNTLSAVVPAFAMNGAPVGIALSDDGDRLAVAADRLYVFSRGTNTPASFGLSAPSAVAIAGSGTHGLVWGRAGGAVDYVVDGATAPVASFLLGTSAVTAVAITRDGTWGAAANAAGRIQVFTLPNATVATLTQVGQVQVAGNVTELVLTPDARHLLVRTAAEVRLYLVGANMTELWSHRPTAAPVGLGLSANADLAATGVGAGVVTYGVSHAIRADLVAETMQPGTARTVTVTYRNDGNRPEKATLEAWFPPGWYAAATPTNITVPVNGTATVDVRIVIPNREAPGTQAILLNHTLASTGATGSTPVRVTVSGRTLVVLDPDGATSKGIRGGETVSFRAVVDNRGNLPGVGQLTMTVEPATWQATLSQETFSLQPGASVNVTVTLTAPREVVEGDAGHVRLVLAQRPDEPLDFYATVGARFRVALSAPSLYTAEVGNVTPISLGLKNEGNVLDSFDLRAEVPEGWTATFANATVRDVDAGAPAGATLLLGVPADAVPGLRVRITVTATSQGNPAQSSERTILVTLVASGQTEPPPEPQGEVNWTLVGGVGLFLLAVGGFIGGSILLRKK